VLTNKTGEEIRTLYPVNSHPENLFRSFFNKNTQNAMNQMNFLAKNYRPKCDMCSDLCDIDWYMQTKANSGSGKTLTNIINNTNSVSDMLLICEGCYENSNFPQGLVKSDFEMANFFNVVNPSESK
jgi:hypothetical protein